MNPKQLIDKALHQWPAKVICLIIAIFLYVFHQVSLIDKKTIVVPLTIQEEGVVMHVGTVPQSVAVVIRTSTDNLKFISANEIDAFVNLDTITEKGVYELPVRVTLSESLQALDPLEVRLKENKIILEVDKKAFKYVKIEPSVVGEVAHGYEISNVAVSPSTVKISGPEAIVNATQQVYTNRINVSNAENSFASNVELQLINKLIDIEENEEFKASVTVSPKYIQRDFKVPVDLMNLPSHLICETGVEDISIRLYGTEKNLEDYHVPRRSIQAYLGDIDEPGIYDIPLRFYFPKNLEILDKSFDTVTVSIVSKHVEVEKTEEASEQVQ